jgi:hypothetical protein
VHPGLDLRRQDLGDADFAGSDAGKTGLHSYQLRWWRL